MNIEEKRQKYYKKKEFVSHYPPLPPYIYKYCPINNNLWKNLLNNQIWFSYPTEFNDPFDCQLDFRLYENESEKLLLIDKLIEWGVIPEKDRKIVFNNPDSIKEYVKNSLENIFKSTGISCFTMSQQFYSQPDDYLLHWSHYADSHKGIRLRFEILDSVLYMFNLESFSDPIFNLRKVDYSCDYPKINFINDKDNFSSKMVSIKSKCWKYEDEVRIISRRYGAVKFKKEALTEIVFGCESDKQNRKDIIKLIKKCNYPNVKFLLAIKRNDKFALEFEEIKI